MSDITEEDVMKYCYSRNLMLVTRESLEYMHRPIVIETMNKNAIPIEWLLKRAEMCTSDYSNCLHYAIEDWLNEQKYMVDGRWKFPGREKENEL